MDLNRLTQKSQEALHDAQTKTLRFGHTEVDGEPDPPPARASSGPPARGRAGEAAPY